MGVRCTLLLASIGIAASALLISVAPWGTRASAQVPGAFIGETPGSGVTLALFSGGSIEDLRFAAPFASSFWTTIDGEPAGYLVDAPEFVNQAFFDLFASGVPASTPLVVLVPDDDAVPAPAQIELTSTCVPDQSVAPPQFRIPCALSVAGAGPVRLTWTVVYTAQPDAENYAGETVILSGSETRVFTLDQTYQSLITVAAEACNPWSCVAMVIYFDG